MNNAFVGIGSNIAGAEAMITEAVQLLRENGVGVIAESGVYMVSQPYLNSVVKVQTWKGRHALDALAKRIEAAMGRTPEMKVVGIVPIDIDVVVFNDEVCRHRDFDAPYFSLGYDKIK